MIILLRIPNVMSGEIVWGCLGIVIWIHIMLQFIIPNQPFMINNLKQDLIGFGWFWSLLMLCSLQSQHIEGVVRASHFVW